MVQVTDMGNGLRHHRFGELYSIGGESGKWFKSQIWEMFTSRIREIVLGGVKKTGAVFRSQIWEI